MHENHVHVNSEICPVWLAGALDSPLRRLLHKPEKIMGDWLGKGQTALDLGCGPGYFTLGMALLVGEGGRVFAVDLQEKMLEMVARKAERAGLRTRITLHQCAPDHIGLQASVDFALAFWMVHEVPDAQAFLQEVYGLLKPGGRFLLVEPRMHVSGQDFQKTVDMARAAGMTPVAEPGVSISRAVLFEH